MPADPLQYYIGKGALEFDTGGGYYAVGNVPTFEVTPSVETLSHYSSLSGVRSLDREVVTTTEVNVRIVLEEWTFENVRVMLLGSETTDGSGNSAVDILANTEITAAVRFTGSNTIGPQYRIVLPSVKFTPASGMNVISEEFGQLELNGKAQLSGGTFGTMALLAVGT